MDIDQINQAEGKGVIDQINISFWKKRELFHTLANDYWKAVNWFVWTLVAVIVIFLVWLILLIWILFIPAVMGFVKSFCVDVCEANSTRSEAE